MKIPGLGLQAVPWLTIFVLGGTGWVQDTRLPAVTETDNLT